MSYINLSNETSRSLLLNPTVDYYWCRHPFQSIYLIDINDRLLVDIHNKGGNIITSKRKLIVILITLHRVEDVPPP
jgi:hypothetical protein